jgi:hypothetical protein
MVSSGMLRLVALVRTDVSIKLTASFIRVTLIMDAIRSSETSVVTRVTRRNIPEDTILNVLYVPLHLAGVESIELILRWAR